MDRIIRSAIGEGQPFSGEQVGRLGSPCKVYRSRDLGRFHTLKDAWGPSKALAVLYETGLNYGHWCCIWRSGPHSVNFFDSYALQPDTELKSVGWSFRRSETGRLQARKDVSRLLQQAQDTGDTIIYNNAALQGPRTNSCGRFCGLRLALRHLSDEEFAGLFLGQKYSPDELVTMLTMFVS